VRKNLTAQKTEREAAMRQFMMTVTALAVFGAVVVTAQAENQTASGPVKKRTVLHKASFAECEKKAFDLGLVPGQSGRICYVRNCMGVARGHGC
jgi:hypothetical protein